MVLAIMKFQVALLLCTSGANALGKISSSDGNVVLTGNDVVFAIGTNGTTSVSHLSTKIGTVADALSQTGDDLRFIAEDLERVNTTLGESIEQQIATLTDASSEADVQLEGRINVALDALVVAANEKHCQDGTFWNNGVGKCTGSPVHLSPSDIDCSATTNGLVKLDDQGKMVVCNGAKAKFTAVGGGGLPGIVEDTPVNNCEEVQVQIGSQFVLKSGPHFWIKGDDETAIKTYCVFPGGGEAAQDMGGDGSSAQSASKSCHVLKEVWGLTGIQKLFIIGEGQVECDFTLGDPSADTANWSGQVNNFVLMAKNYAKGYTGAVQVVVRSASEYAKFKKGMWVIVHQTQHTSSSMVGQYEWNILKLNPTSNTVQFVKPLNHAYESGVFNKAGAKTVQILTVPYVKTGTVSSTITTRAWDGYTGGIVALKALNKVVINKDINVVGKGFRGGAPHSGSGSCKAHASSGTSGESFAGPGKRDGISAGFGCCRGTSNAATGYNGRSLNNEGGGGGGGGACHGGGGAGGGYGSFDGTTKCPNACGHKGNAGDGSPECYRAGSWSKRGDSYGDDVMTRPNMGSGGGGGNSYSPSSSQKNGGGEGGGLIMIDGGEEIVLGNAKLLATGKQGWPLAGTSLYNWWRTSNPQDGSGGSGSGGGILLSAANGKSTINLNGANRALVGGGPCGCDNGWRSRAQMGGAGGQGRIAAVAGKISGSAANMKAVQP